MYLSVIIPAYNEEKLLGNTIESVLKAKEYFEKHTNEKMEIIVVDNASTDQTKDIANKYNVLVVEEVVHNIAKVRNTGATYAQGKVLCFIDADTQVSIDLFALIKNAMHTNQYIGGGTKFKLDRKNIIFLSIYYSSIFFMHVFRLSGVCIYTTKETFNKIHGFDTSLYAGEDIDFVQRLKRYGDVLNLKYSTIYKGFAITSSRRYKMKYYKELIDQVRLMLRKSLRKDAYECRQWYDVEKFRD